MSKLEFEKPILELEGKIAELRKVSDTDEFNISEEIQRMQSKVTKMLQQTYSKLSAEQKVQVARHNNRPHFSDYVKDLIEDFTPLAGERCYGDDKALLGGMGRFRGQSCVIMGHEKGRDTESRIHHNFGMARPEGYRKAQRLMKLADQYQLPIITLVDTAGAYPGVGAEERGQAEAIAKSIESCFRVGVPLLSVIIGEGGSGGAVAIAAANRILMLEHSIYSVISPEGCASILWRSATYSNDAANALKLTAQDLHELGLIDEIIPEPVGGAHRAREATIESVGDALETHLKQLLKLDSEKLQKDREEKFLAMGRAA